MKELEAVVEYIKQHEERSHITIKHNVFCITSEQPVKPDTNRRYEPVCIGHFTQKMQILDGNNKLIFSMADNQESLTSGPTAEFYVKLITEAYNSEIVETFEPSYSSDIILEEGPDCFYVMVPLEEVLTNRQLNLRGAFFSVNNSGGYRNTDIRCIANDMMSDKKHESFIMLSIYENEPTLCCQNVTARNKNTGNDVVLKLPHIINAAWVPYDIPIEMINYDYTESWGISLCYPKVDLGGFNLGGLLHAAGFGRIMPASKLYGLDYRVKVLEWHHVDDLLKVGY